MNDIIKLIEEVEKMIFAFHIQPAMQQFTLLTEELIQISGYLSPSKLEDLLLIIKAMNSALMNKDYFLLNDILEYELKPFVELDLCNINGIGE